MIKKSICSILLLMGLLFASGCSNRNPRNLDDIFHNDDPVNENENPSISPFALDEKIKRIQVVTDDVGIYAVNIYLSDKVADSGNLEFIYKGAKGSPQENSTVALYTLEYSKTSSGFEITTTYNGDPYQNFHKLEEVKFLMEFGASIRAGDVTINYSDNNVGKQQIFYTSEACSYHN